MLSAELVVAAYCRGYFPMADPQGSIGWYLPDRRAVFLQGDARISHSLARLIRRGRFHIAIDRDFAGVIRACASREETWISDEIQRVYLELHNGGFSHSVEAYDAGQLVGGLYGVAVGGAFFGESMFHSVTDASKVAFATLCQRLDDRGFLIHDAQFMTPHLASLGAREISKLTYLRLLRPAVQTVCRFV
jgi:leucyl/phenylalanyl-tRNA--protein transferase